MAQQSLVKIDPTLSFDVAALFGCAVITGVGAVFNTAQLPRGATVAVIGLGGVGLAALLGIAMLDPRILIAVDLSLDKLAVAKRLGATHVLAGNDPHCIDAARELTHGGAQYVFEMAGSVPALQAAYSMTRRGGMTVTAGLPRPQALFSIPQVSISAEERTIKGSYLGSCQPKRDIPRYVEWYQAGKLSVDQLLSERIKLENINEGFDRLASGQTIRQIILN